MASYKDHGANAMEKSGSDGEALDKDAMTSDEVMEAFKAAGALLSGHFVLSSGLHSDTYFSKSIVATQPARAERLCRALAAKLRADAHGPFDCVISPAMGAIIYGYETARALGLPFMFAERVDGQFDLRRGFALEKGASVLVVEDIVSTGLSARECVACVTAAGGVVKALGCLVDRSNGSAEVGAPLAPLLSLKVDAWPADDLPPHLADTPAVKPGSRGVSQ